MLRNRATETVGAGFPRPCLANEPMVLTFRALRVLHFLLT